MCEFRRIYRAAGISLQKMRARLGPLKLPSYEKQLEDIQKLQREIQTAKDEGMELA